MRQERSGGPVGVVNFDVPLDVQFRCTGAPASRARDEIHPVRAGSGGGGIVSAKPLSESTSGPRVGRDDSMLAWNQSAQWRHAADPAEVEGISPLPTPDRIESDPIAAFALVGVEMGRFERAMMPGRESVLSDLESDEFINGGKRIV
jgi:hypothetical protein